MILQFNSLALDKRYQTTDSELPFEYCYALRLPLYLVTINLILSKTLLTFGSIYVQRKQRQLPVSSCESDNERRKLISRLSPVSSNPHEG